MSITQFFSKLLPQLSKCVVSGTIISPGGYSVCPAGLSETLLHYSLLILWPTIDPILVTFGQMSSYDFKNGIKCEPTVRY